MAFVNEKDHTPMRTIDYDRDVYLTNVRGKGSDINGSERFELNWKEKPIEFDALEHVSYTDDEKDRIIDWTIERIYMSESLKKDLPEIKQLITEALDEYGHIYSRRMVRFVHVKFSSKVK